MGILSNNWIQYSIILLLNISGFLFFLKGFFPTKVVLAGYSSFEDPSPFLKDGESMFDGLVFMVVDALRADFLYSEESSMEFVHTLINEGNALPFTAFSNPPTVTLPRLKGITTGGTPSFIDAVLNIADDKDKSQGLSNQDSWLHQFVKGKNKKVHFYGDDTWLKLFPHDEFFEYFEGTNSFYVSDFTEVDNNVTRHLDNKLSNSSWDGLILHYLGLDHIGHKGGPESPFMKPKQKEMDDIIKKLYDYTSKKNKLLVLLGDHGMNEIGNHGGSSPGETSAGMMFISPKFKVLKKNNVAPVKKTSDYTYFKKINQIDLVPTLSLLLNLPIPKNNMGIIIDDFLDLWNSDNSKLTIVRQNYNQLMDLATKKYGISEDSFISQMSILLSSKSTVNNYYDVLRSIQSNLTSSATDYNYRNIWIGVSLIALSTIMIITVCKTYFVNGYSVKKSLIGIYFLFVLTFSIHYHGSSLIEEEHQIWWFFTVLYLISFFYYHSHKSFINFMILASGIRIIRAWSNTGQKYFTLNTIGQYLSDNSGITWGLVILTYMYYAFVIYAQGGLIYSFALSGVSKLNFNDIGNLLAFMYSSITCSISLLFKIIQAYSDGTEIPKWLNWLLFWILQNPEVEMKGSQIDTQEILYSLSKVFSILIFIMLIFRVLTSKVRSIEYGFFNDISNIFTVLLMHQNKIENIPMFSVFALIRYSFGNILEKNKAKNNNLDESMIFITTFILLMQNISFFSVGNTNSLATVDLSNAYNGVKEYDLNIVGLLTFLSTFSMPIYWSLSFLCLIFENEINTFKYSSETLKLSKLKFKILYVKSILSLLFYAICSFSLVLSCINLRFHLFIWSVFSPKLLYFSSWSILMNILVDLVISGVLLLSY